MDLIRKKNVFNTPIVIAIFSLFFFTQCKKDPVSGWTFYTDTPPSPEIISVNTLIKNCVPPYPVSFSHEANYLLGNVQYLWDFGDGNTSTQQNPTHIYEEPGDYSVTFVISNELGTDTKKIEIPQLAQPGIPVQTSFSYSHSNQNNFAPNKVNFTNSSSGANVFAWQFGDGVQSNNESPEHIFQNAGQYTVTLTGTCTDGSTNETTQQVFISPPPQRIFIDSITLMLPSSHRNQLIYIDIYHNTTLIGTTTSRSGTFPMKFRNPQHFPAGYFFDFVSYGQNEVFKFVVAKDRGSEEPPEFLYEIALSSFAIQSNFYPRAYYQIEHVPKINDVFIDLYMSY